MMPIVAAVPKDVPVKSETKQQSRKTIKMNTDGMSEVKPAVLQTELHPYHQEPELKVFLKENGIVPQARQTAVIIPIRIKMKRIFLIVRIPRPDIVSICTGVCPCRRA